MRMAILITVKSIFKKLHPQSPKFSVFYFSPKFVFPVVFSDIQPPRPQTPYHLNIFLTA